MNTLEISAALAGNKFTKSSFKGVYALNRIPKVLIRPAAIVVNTDPSSQPGTHWIAMYFPRKGCAEFFDSYGLRPSRKEFVETLQSNAGCYISNGKRLQGDFSSVCGQYCCLFIWNRCKKKSMADFIQLFSRRQQHLNDRKAEQMFRHIFSCRTSMQQRSRRLQR